MKKNHMALLFSLFVSFSSAYAGHYVFTILNVPHIKFVSVDFRNDETLGELKVKLAEEICSYTGDRLETMISKITFLHVLEDDSTPIRKANLQLEKRRIVVVN